MQAAYAGATSYVPQDFAEFLFARDMGWAYDQVQSCPRDVLEVWMRFWQIDRQHSKPAGGG